MSTLAWSMQLETPKLNKYAVQNSSKAFHGKSKPEAYSMQRELIKYNILAPQAHLPEAI